MGVLLTAARDRRRRRASASGPSAAGRRAPRTPRRKALLVLLYVLLPPVDLLQPRRGRRSTSTTASGSAWRWSPSALAAVFAWWVASRVLQLPAPQVGAVVCAVLSVNTGYLGYPLTVALLGRDQLSTAVLYDVLVTGPSLLLGAFARRRRLRDQGRRKRRASGSRAFFTRNPPLYAAIAGLLAPERAGAAGPRRRLPGAGRRDPADRLLRRRRHPGRGRRARRAAAAAAADPAGGARGRRPPGDRARRC